MKVDQRSHQAFGTPISYAGPAVGVPENSSGYKVLERYRSDGMMRAFAPSRALVSGS